MTARPRRRPALVAIAALVLAAGSHADAQTSTGTITGLVTDRHGAPIAGAEVHLVQADTGFERLVTSAANGWFASPIVPPGTYDVHAIGGSLRSIVARTSVRAGAVTTVDLQVTIDVPGEEVTVVAGLRRRDDHHGVGGWIGRADIDRQPLNGRTVLELAKLEPGVLPPERLSGGRVFIAPLGAGLQTIPRVGFTRVTLDGGHFETPGTVGSLLQVSPEVVDQIHVASVNFDASTGLATSGAVNIVTRSGTNRMLGSAFTLYRDAEWSAYPIDAFGAVPVDPSFRRSQSGGTAGGPLRRDRAFFFAAYERHDQRDLLSVRPSDPALAAFAGTYVSPYSGTLFSSRADVRLTDRHRLFVRHTLDWNSAVSVADAAATLPSGWSHRPVRASQTMATLTSVPARPLVHELRVSHYAVETASEPVTQDECDAPCFGFGAPRITLSDGAAGELTFGTAGVTTYAGRRIQVSDSLAWQSGAHLVRFGGDWEYVRASNYVLTSTPVQLTLWAPAAVQARNPSLALPASLDSVDDMLKLPLHSFSTSVGSGATPQRDFQALRSLHLVRLHAGDQWHVGPRLSVNAGVAWSWEPHVLNDDLTRPDWLSPLVAGRPLDVPSSHQYLSALAGLTWQATADGRTIVRAGAGRYIESVGRTVTLNLTNERVLLSPLGTGRLVVSGANLFRDGVRLHFPSPTGFTGADLLAALPGIRASLASSLNPGNRDSSVVNLDRTKEGRNLYDPDYETPRALHVSAGIERDFGRGVVASADVTFRRFSHTFINGIDYNRFFSADGPVIRACAPDERLDVTATCSNGSLFYDTTSGRARYIGLLVRAEKRFGARAQVMAAYALGRFSGTNGTGTGTSEAGGGRVFGFNNDDWFENDGPLPTDHRHVLNMSGFLMAPWDVQLSWNFAAYDRPPFSPYVGGMDFNGDGTLNDLLPGTTVNQFNRGLSKDDLVALVARYNDEYAGLRTAGGQFAPVIVLPETFSFYDTFVTFDLRAGRVFDLRPPVRLTVFVDVFNVFNTVNLTGHGSNLASPASFGRANARVGQAYGSGGPRAAQLGLRVGF